jgi:L-lactate utilization protein LutC
MAWNLKADENTIQLTQKNLQAHGFTVYVAQTADDAKNQVLSLIPKGASVMTMSSTTLVETGIKDAVDTSGEFVSYRTKLTELSKQPDTPENQKAKLSLGYEADVALGSVQAVTQSGEVVMASYTGSQIPAYAFGAKKVVWVVGSQKIVKNMDEAFKRIYDYALPLVSEQVKKTYGGPGSSVNKMLIVNKEPIPNRTAIIFVNEILGF